MRVFAWILIVVTVLTLGLVGYELATLKLSVGEVQVSVLPADQNPGLFENLRREMENDALTGRVFRQEPIESPAEYVFVTYTVPVQNLNFLSAEWIELVVQPQEGDVVQLSTGDAQRLPGLSRANLNATVLCRLDAQAAASRSAALELQYFLFGRPYSFKIQ